MDCQRRLSLRSVKRVWPSSTAHVCTVDRFGLNFVLLGSLQSDSFERRFGWWRQSSGANYYISARQIQESYRKIRTLSLVKYSKITLEEIDGIIQSRPSLESADDESADDIVNLLQFHHSPNSNDNNNIYYVIGYIARSIIRTTKCDDCRECLATDGQMEPSELDISATDSSDLIVFRHNQSL